MKKSRAAGHAEELATAAAVGMSAEWQSGFQSAVEKANDGVLEAMPRKANLADPQLQGFFAEHWHAKTLEIDAYKQGLWDLVAEVPERTDLASPDIVVRRGDEILVEVQSKYFKTADRTAAQLWNPDYNDVAKVVPADQATGVVDANRVKATVEAASRPHVAEAAQHSVENVSDRVTVDGVESRPLGRADSQRLARDAAEGGAPFADADFLSAGEIGSRAVQAGAVGAGIGIALGAAPDLLRAVRLWKDGAGLGDEELREALSSAGERGLKAGGWASLQAGMGSVLVDLAATGRLGDLLGGASPGAVGAISVTLVRAIKLGLQWSEGTIDGVRFAQGVGEAAVVSAASVGGAALGQALIPIPVIGALIGSTVGGLLARGGIAAVHWTVREIGPYVAELVEAAANTLFGLDVIAEGLAQTERLDQLFEEARVVLADREGHVFSVLSEIQLEAFDLAPAARELAGHDAFLKQLGRP